MVGDSFEGNMDLFLWNHSATHNPGAVDELIIYGVCKPAYMRANCKHTKCMNFKKCIVLHVLAKPIANTLLFMQIIL